MLNSWWDKNVSHLSSTYIYLRSDVIGETNLESRFNLEEESIIHSLAANVVTDFWRCWLIAALLLLLSDSITSIKRTFQKCTACINKHVGQDAVSCFSVILKGIYFSETLWVSFLVTLKSFSLDAHLLSCQNKVTIVSVWCLLLFYRVVQ